MYSECPSLLSIDLFGSLEFFFFLLQMKELVSFWLLTLLLVVIVLVSVLGNLLVCLAVKTDKNLRKLSNLFLVSLAIADLLVRMDD